MVDCGISDEAAGCNEPDDRSPSKLLEPIEGPPLAASKAALYDDGGANCWPANGLLFDKDPNEGGEFIDEPNEPANGDAWGGGAPADIEEKKLGGAIEKVEPPRLNDGG